MKYGVKYSCGHDGTVTLYGRIRERERKIEWMEKQLCPQCKRDMEQKENDDFEAEYEGLASLKGSEKQIAYGRTCRRHAIIEYESMIDSGMAENNEDWREYFCREESASWWIDIIEFGRSLEWKRKHMSEAEIARANETQLNDENVIAPENQTTNDIAEISLGGDEILVKSPKNYTIIDTVKEHGYKWNGRRWYLTIGVTTGNVEDRIAEIGNALLLKGVPVAISDEKARVKAADGTFEPLNHRWITITDDGKLCIRWEKGDDSMYYAALRLPHAKYRSGRVVVAAKHFAEIMDFASLNDYSITDKARKALENAENAYNTAKRITPIEGHKAAQKDGLKEILESDREVLDDLKDD